MAVADRVNTDADLATAVRSIYVEVEPPPGRNPESSVPTSRTTYPPTCLVHGAAVWDRFRCMACPTESDLEPDNTPVVRRS